MEPAAPAPPLVHVCHAPADHGRVRGRMLSALGLAEGQYCTRADDVLGAAQLDEIIANLHSKYGRIDYKDSRFVVHPGTDRPAVVQVTGLVSRPCRGWREAAGSA